MAGLRHTGLGRSGCSPFLSQATAKIMGEGSIMSKERDTYKYHYKIGNKIVHGGITNDLERREQEHQDKWPKGHIKQVGRRTTEEAARKWEKDKGFS